MDQRYNSLFYTNLLIYRRHSAREGPVLHVMNIVIAAGATAEADISLGTDQRGQVHGLRNDRTHRFGTRLLGQIDL